MGLFSFLFDRQQPAGGGFVSEATIPHQPPGTPYDMGGPAPTHAVGQASPDLNPAFALNVGGDYGEMREVPHMESHPGLLSRLGQTVTSPNFMLALGTALKSYGGDDNAVAEASQMQKQRMEFAQFQRQLALQQRGNQAFRAAYQNGKFDPQVYAQVMGDALDPEALAKLATTFNHKVTLQGDRIVDTDPIGGGLTIKGMADPDYNERIAAANSAETHRHNSVEEGQGSQRLGIEAGQLGVAQQNAATSRGQLGVAQQHLTLDRQQAGRQPGPQQITSQADYNALPPGAQYIDPHGNLRVKGTR